MTSLPPNPSFPPKRTGTIAAASEHLPEVPLPDLLDKVLVDPAVIKEIRQFPEKARLPALGWVMNYVILHKSSEKLDHYLRELNSLAKRARGGEISPGDRNEVLLASVLDHLGLANAKGPQAERECLSLIWDRTCNPGFLFHGFNGAWASAIMNEGLSPERRSWKAEQPARLAELGKKAGFEMLCGWLDVNCKNSIFLDGHTAWTARYAYASPEWFAQFVSEGFHVPVDPQAKEAYYRRDRGAARNNVERWCTQVKDRLSEAEREEVLQIFETLWASFAEGAPKVALVSRAAVMPAEDPEILLQMIDSGSPFEPSRLLLQMAGMTLNDFRTDKKIEPQFISIVTLPRYSEIFP